MALFENYMPPDIQAWERFQRDTSPMWQTINNGLTVASQRFTIAAGATRYIGLIPAASKKVFLVSRTITISASALNIDVVTLATYVTGAEVAVKTPCNSAATPMTSVVYTNVTVPTGETVREYGYANAGTGPSSVTAASVVNGNDVVKVFTGPVFLKLQNTGSDSATVTFNALGWEENA